MLGSLATMRQLSSAKPLRMEPVGAATGQKVVATSATPSAENSASMKTSPSLQWCGFDGIKPAVFANIGTFLAVGDNSDHVNLGLLAGTDASRLIHHACLPQLHNNEAYLRRAMRSNDRRTRKEQMNCWLKMNYKALNGIHMSKSVGGLHLCALDSHESSVGVMKALLEDHKADVNAFDGSNGFTPLHYACLSFTSSHSVRLAKIKLLMEAGADPIIESAGGKMPIEILYKEGARRRDMIEHDGFKEIAGVLLQGKKNV